VLQLHVHGGVHVVGGSAVLHCSSAPGSGRAHSTARAAAVCGSCAAALRGCRLAPPCECRVRDRAWAWRWRATGASRERGSTLWRVAVWVAPWRARASSLALRWRTGGGGRARLGAWRSGGGVLALAGRGRACSALVWRGTEAARRVEGGSGRERRPKLGLPLGRATMDLYWAATADRGCPGGDPLLLSTVPL
jgi:hypothetical protein